MAEKSKAFDKSLRIRYRGQYDYDGLIALLRSFFDRAKIDLEQPKFKYKGEDTGFEVEFTFTGDRKVNQYIKVYITIEGHGYDVNPKEVVVNGVKKRMTGGKMELYFQAHHQLDWGEGFTTDPKDSNLRKKTLEKMKKFLDEDFEGVSFEDNKALGKKHIQTLLKKFHAETVKFLGMECY